jgi:glycosyltransferase involved in cell wall biosynthesis
MKPRLEPLVSVVTPVYNGAEYLAQCIESVLAQTYRNWEYVIVNNCCTDNTLEIARAYAEQDHRIRVVTNARFVGVIENHNIAFRLISPESSYCKVVSADDYLFPECIEKLVDMAEREPRVAIVGSYAINDLGVHRIGLPPDKSVWDGSEFCRLYFLGDIEPVGAPSSLLYRSALIRAHDPFYPGTLPNADVAACLACLRDGDFGLVHQILSYERIHAEALSTGVRELNGFLIDRIQFLREYGSLYLGRDAIERRERELLRELYSCLATAALHRRGKAFWNYQCERLRAVGYPIGSVRLMGAVCLKLADLIFNPKQTLEKAFRRRRPAWTSRVGAAGQIGHSAPTNGSDWLQRRAG